MCPWPDDHLRTPCSWTPCTWTSCIRTLNLMAIHDEDFSLHPSKTGNYNSPILRRGNLQYYSKFHLGVGVWGLGRRRWETSWHITETLEHTTKPLSRVATTGYWPGLNPGSSWEFPALLEWFCAGGEGVGGGVRCCQMCRWYPNSQAPRTKLTQHYGRPPTCSERTKIVTERLSCWKCIFMKIRFN